MNLPDSPDLRKLQEDILSDVGAHDPERQALVARVTANTLRLQAMQLAGQNVDHEMAIVKATAANLSEAARNAIANRLMTFAEDLIGAALLRI